MTSITNEQLLIAAKKYTRTFLLLEASVKKTTDYDIEKNFSADELEPYDALSDRFIRSVEIAIKFFKTYEYHFQAEQSQTLRDGLHQMEKFDLISNLDIWIDMRDIRNRIVHDYIPEKIAQMYQLIRGNFYLELKRLNNKIINMDIIHD
ncbi:nucleotidyltransferase substrate binding protein [sulfur-oxidizing endosymbiont of Gigantopelta aegis]|uniref:nucleotidyltransferase substrate binding protein n=1 Tax=sulfur-oxidizing endosymbiont of Gigantopelta aegis TaxID=2794934 RepID=UPI0018DBEC14|nr:nucleotidyltransferase substrate binding protein [sulfur-oxidizing endosymbiont of Gigantopelta aegis]